MGTVNYKNIENTIRECGNMGGIATEVYYAPLSFFKSLATKKTCEDDRELEEMNLLSEGVDELLPGKKLSKIYSTMEKGSLNAERQGEADGISHKIVLSLFNPGLNSSSLGILQTPNQDFIFFVKTGNKMFRVGNESFPAKMAAEGEAGTGDATGSAKGNTMSFYSYEDGFAGEVIDISSIQAMLTNIDENLTTLFTPSQNDTEILVSTIPTIVFSKPVINSDTGIAFTDQEITSALTLKKVDVNGDYISDVPFLATILAETATITPDTNFDNSSIFELKFDKSKVLSLDENGRVNGSNFARFITA
ncbi:MAG: hypothetical protein U9N34_01585 [Candidatus Cloacimonadota bacterium]|nr:hypothetical protein [Candidatus Cloacimonadota bacterium]